MRNGVRIFGIEWAQWVKWFSPRPKKWDKRRGRHLKDGEVRLKKGEELDQGDDDPYYSSDSDK
jgi:hypothetical protein